MIHYWYAFLIALQLLTRLPVSFLLPASAWSSQTQAYSPLFYPIVGMLLAGILLLVSVLLPSQFSASLSAGLLLVCWVVLTGALHLDGFADSIDAAFAGHAGQDSPEQREKILRVFKDPAAGPMAVVGLVLLLLLKWLLLTSLSSYWLLVLCLALPLARVMALLYIVSTPYVSTQGLGSGWIQSVPKGLAVFIGLLSFLLSLIFLSFVKAFILFTVLALLLWWWRYVWLQKIQGFVGDCVGALIELSEVTILLVLCFLLL